MTKKELCEIDIRSEVKVGIFLTKIVNFMDFDLDKMKHVVTSKYDK